MIIAKFMGALFEPKFPRHYTGRHRARLRLRTGRIDDSADRG